MHDIGEIMCSCEEGDAGDRRLLMRERNQSMIREGSSEGRKDWMRPMTKRVDVGIGSGWVGWVTCSCCNAPTMASLSSKSLWLCNRTVWVSE